VDVAASGKKWLSNFEVELVIDLAGLRKLYDCNVQGISGLCSSVPDVGSSVMDYIRWLSTEVAGLPEMFVGVNDNFISDL
jgi:hypothetical protein